MKSRVQAIYIRWKWGLFLLLLVGIMGCSSAAPPTESTSMLPERLAEALPSEPQDPELMVKALQEVFKKWALAGNLEGNPDVLAGFHQLLSLSNLEPVETMQSWLAEAKAEATEPVDFTTLESEVSADVQPLTFEESFFHIWRHAYESPDAADDAGVRLALIVAVGDENLQREIVRAWQQLIENE
jgi:hypothetical protein